jgi:hypothetical protein
MARDRGRFIGVGRDHLHREHDDDHRHDDHHLRLPALLLLISPS